MEIEEKDKIIIMMKTIEETAREYICKELISPDSEAAFIAGIEYAQHWISVNEEMPKERKMVLVKIHLTTLDDKTTYHYSMGKTINEKTAAKWYILHSLIENYFNCKTWTVTHWRPINYERRLS